MNIYELSMAGVNVAEGVKRFNGNREMYKKYVMRFAEDPNYQRLCDAVAARNAAEAFEAAHALKGIAGNLSMTKIYNDIFPLVEVLRHDSFENADELLEQVSSDYDAVVSALE